MPSQTEHGVRRVVTGLDTEGRSRIVHDEVVEPITSELMPGFAAYRLWGLEAPPTLPDDGSAGRTDAWFPPRDGSRFMVITHPPEGQSPPADVNAEAAGDALDRQMPGVRAATEPDGMHTTDTVDYLMVVSGEATLELDGGATTILRPGDVIVQNGTRHAWRNHGSVSCTLVAVSVGADRAEATR